MANQEANILQSDYSNCTLIIVLRSQLLFTSRFSRKLPRHKAYISRAPGAKILDIAGLLFAGNYFKPCRFTN
jgi:hypothetical protein